MEAADSSETLVSVTQLHGSISQMTVMWRIKKSCVCFSLNRLVLYYQ
jgi:hypothetical protein